MLEVAPNKDWIEEFRNLDNNTNYQASPNHGYSSFRGDTAEIEIRAKNNVQQLVDFFKKYVSRGNARYKARQENETRQQEHRVREELGRRTKGAKLKEHLLGKPRL